MNSVHHHHPHQETHFPQLNDESPSPTIRGSWGMIVLACLQVIFTAFLLGWCIWSAIMEDSVPTSYIGIASGVCHMSVGIVAIIGGRDVVRNRLCVKTTLILSIPAAVIFALLTAVIAGLSTIYHKEFCESLCMGKRCGSTCSISSYVLYGPEMVISIIQAIIDFILCSIACFYVCQCCNRNSTTRKTELVGDNNCPSYPVTYLNGTLTRPRLTTPPPCDDLPPMYTPGKPLTDQPIV